MTRSFQMRRIQQTSDPSIARAVIESADDGANLLLSRSVLLKAEAVMRDGGTESALDLVKDVRGLARRQGKGLLLIIDEFGKNLEYSASCPSDGDLFLLQRLAEMCARSGENRFVLTVLLHHGFATYAERLPSQAKYEWKKVSGRFDEIVFDQSLEHAVSLVSSALGVDESVIGSVAKYENDVWERLANCGWLGRVGDATFSPVFPLHPVLIPVLVRFFRRYGQNERSLPRKAQSASAFRLDEVYDYIRANFGHHLGTEAGRATWSRCVATVEADVTATETQHAIMKANFPNARNSASEQRPSSSYAAIFVGGSST
jgi:hypothetical protein